MTVDTANHHRDRATFRSLRTMGILSLVAPILIYALFAGYQLYEASEEAEQRVSRSLRVAHEHLSNVLGNAAALQERIGDQVRGSSLADLRARQPQLHEMLKEAVRDRPQIQSIWIIGADGKAVATSRFALVPDLDFTDRPYFKHHAAALPGRFVSPPFLSRTTNERILDLSMRVTDERGGFLGVINVSLLASYFGQFYSDQVSDEPGLAVNLFHADGSIYARWPVLANAPPRLASSSPTMKLISQGQVNGLVRGVSSVDGEERLIAFRQVRGYPVFVGTGMNLSVMRVQLLKDLGILWLFGLVPFVALYLTARIASRRTREALSAAQQLEAETLSRLRAEEALLQSQKLEAMGRLTGGVAHDFNNALMVISNNAYLLQRAVSGPATRQIESIKRAVDSATKLTRQLLAFSRRQALVPEIVQLQARLPVMADLVGPAMGSQVTMDVSVSPDTLPIKVDAAELELSLLNLGINARDAMPKGGRFSLLAKNAAGAGENGAAMVCIEATDTGEGIPPDLLKKVMEPFFTTKPVGQGTGLGLSQVYGMCQRAGGTVEVRSELGVGTTVAMFFPAVPGDALGANAEERPAARNLDLDVLLVEDNQDVAAAVGDLLAALGCRVVRVDRADAARERLAAQDRLPDVVLSDVVMPGSMNGVQLAQHVRETYPDLRMVLMTGHAAQIDSITEQGFEVLPKPCTAEQLSDVLVSGRRGAA